MPFRPSPLGGVSYRSGAAFRFREVRDHERERKDGGKEKTATSNGGAQGAACKAKGNGYWRKSRRSGERVVIDPDGHIYHGTAKDIRDAAFMPYHRAALAESLKLARYIAAECNFTPEERREYIREKRRDAISMRHLDEVVGTCVHIPADLYLQLAAGARLVLADGETLDDFFAQLFRSSLDGPLDVAENQTGKREIPMSRHERAVLRSSGRGAVWTGCGRRSVGRRCRYASCNARRTRDKVRMVGFPRRDRARCRLFSFIPVRRANSGNPI